MQRAAVETAAELLRAGVERLLSAVAADLLLTAVEDLLRTVASVVLKLLAAELTAVAAHSCELKLVVAAAAALIS